MCVGGGGGLKWYVGYYAGLSGLSKRLAGFVKGISRNISGGRKPTFLALSTKRGIMIQIRDPGLAI